MNVCTFSGKILVTVASGSSDTKICERASQVRKPDCLRAQIVERDPEHNNTYVGFNPFAVANDMQAFMDCQKCSPYQVFPLSVFDHEGYLSK